MPVRAVKAQHLPDEESGERDRDEKEPLPGRQGADEGAGRVAGIEPPVAAGDQGVPEGVREQHQRGGEQGGRPAAQIAHLGLETQRQGPGGYEQIEKEILQVTQEPAPSSVLTTAGMLLS